MTITANLKTDIYERRTKGKKDEDASPETVFFFVELGTFPFFFFFTTVLNIRITCCFLCPFHHFRRCVEVRKETATMHL